MALEEVSVVSLKLQSKSLEHGTDGLLVMHILHVGHVPIVERLVERICGFKHLMHLMHFGHVPIVERLVERACAIKHSGHMASNRFKTATVLFHSK